jgi:hypothetical protein
MSFGHQAVHPAARIGGWPGAGYALDLSASARNPFAQQPTSRILALPTSDADSCAKIQPWLPSLQSSDLLDGVALRTCTCGH